MKNKKGIIIGIVVVLLLLVVGIYMAKNVLPTVKATIEIANALQPFLDADNQTMHFEVDAEVEDKSIEINADIYATKEEDKNYLVIEQENMCFYVVDNLVLLENGKAFLLSEDGDNGKKQMPNSMEILPLLAVAFEEFSIQRKEGESKIQYQIEITGNQVQKILDASIPSQVDIGASVESLQVQLTTQAGELAEIRMTGKGSAKDAFISLDVVLSDFKVLEDGEYPIPQLIKDSVQNVDKDKLFCLTEDLYPLLKAVKPLTDINNLQGIMNWKVSCGLIQINNCMDLEKLNSLKQESSNGEASQNSEETAAQLLALVGAMLWEGELSCTELNGSYAYSLILEEDAMKEIAEMLAPEIVIYVVNFEKGSMELIVNEEMLSKLTIGIHGTVPVIFTTVPVEVNVSIDFK